MKNKLLKSIFAIVLCAIMLIPFTACGGGKPDGNGPDIPDIPTTGELQFDENGKVVFKNVTIRLETVVNGDDTGAFDAIVAKFNMVYDGKIAINTTHTGSGVYENTVASKIQGNNNPPDLIMSHQKSHKNFQVNGFLQPLDGIMEKSGITINMSNYAQGLAQYTKHGTNSLYSVPIDFQTHVALYNKEELAKINKTLPTNRQELLDVCDAYQKATSNTAIAWSTSADYFSNYVYISAVLQNGAKLYDETTFLADWYDNTANRTAIENANNSIRELINKGYARYNAGSSDNLNNFMAGKSLFYFCDPWSIDNLVSKYAEQKKVKKSELLENTIGGACFSGWFAMTDNAQKNAIFGDSHFFAMTKSVTDINKQAAILEFINWYTSDAESGADWAQAGHVSVSNVISDSNDYKTNMYVTSCINGFYPNINDLVCVGSTQYYDTVINNLKSLFAETVNDKTLDKSYNDSDDDKIIRSKQNAVNAVIGVFG